MGRGIQIIQIWCAVGVLLVTIGVLAIWFPWLLPGLHVSSMPTM